MEMTNIIEGGVAIDWQEESSGKMPVLSKPALPDPFGMSG